MIAMTIYVMIARVRRNRGSMPAGRTGGRRSERAWQLEAKQDQRADTSATPIRSGLNIRDGWTAKP